MTTLGEVHENIWPQNQIDATGSGPILSEL